MRNINFWISDDSYEVIMRHKIYHSTKRLQDSLDEIIKEYKKLKLEIKELRKR